jgi:hypothetical protein
MAKPPQTREEAQRAISELMRQQPKLERELELEMARYTDSEGNPVYTQEQIQEEIARLRGMSFEVGYAKNKLDRAYEEDNVAPVTQSIRQPDSAPLFGVDILPTESDLQKMLDSLKKQSTIPLAQGEGTLRGQFDEAFNPRAFTTLYLDELVNRGVDANQAAMYTVGLEATYDYYISKGHKRIDALQKALDTSNEMQSIDLDVSKLPTFASKQSKELDPIAKQRIEGTLPDLTENQMAYLDGIRGAQIDMLRTQNVELLQRQQVPHMKITVKGLTRDIPTELYMYLQENLPYYPKGTYITTDKVLEDAFRNDSVGVVDEGVEYDMLLKGRNITGLAEVQARKNVGKTKDNWFLDPESKKHVLENAQDFIDDDGIFYDDTITGGTVETDLSRGLRFLFTANSAAYGFFLAPTVNYGLDIFAEYIGRPISKSAGGLQQELGIDLIPQEAFAESLYTNTPQSFSELGTRILDVPEEISKLEKERQEYLAKTMPQYVNVNNSHLGRVAEQVARGGGIMLGAIDTAKTQGYDPATTVLTAATGLYGDFRNPIDHVIFDAGRAVFTAPKSVKLEKQLMQANLGLDKLPSIPEEIIRQTIRYQIADNRHIGNLVYKSLPKSYQNKIGQIDDIQDIRNLQATKIRHNLEAYETFVDMSAKNKTNAEIAQRLRGTPMEQTSIFKIIDENPLVDQKTLRKTLEKGFVYSDNLPSLKNYRELQQVYRTLKPGMVFEKVAQSILKNPQVAKNENYKTAIRGLEDLIRTRYGKYHKLTEENIVNLGAAYRHRTAMMAMADMLPGIGKLPKILGITPNTFVTPKQQERIMKVFDKDRATLIWKKANIQNGSQVKFSKGMEVEADYFRGAFRREADWDFMIYYNNTEDDYDVFVSLKGLQPEEIDVLRNTIIDAPLVSFVKKRMLKDLDELGVISTNNWNKLADVRIDNIAEQMAMGLREPDLVRLNEAQQSNLAEAFGHVSKNSLVVSLRDAYRRTKNAEGLKNKFKVMIGKGDPSLQSSIPETSFLLTEQQVMRRLPGEINTAMDNVRENAAMVIQNPSRYNVTKEDLTTLEALQAWAVGLKQKSPEGLLAQKNRISDMLEFFIQQFVYSVEIKPNYSMVDYFFTPKKNIAQNMYTPAGKKALRLFVEGRVNKILENPQTVADELIITANEWAKLLLNPEKMKELKYIDPSVPITTIKFEMKNIVEKLEEVALRMYEYSVVQKAQNKLIVDVVLPKLPEVILSSMRGKININRPEYNQLLKNFMGYMLGPKKPTYEDQLNYAKELLNQFGRKVDVEGTDLQSTYNNLNKNLRSNIVKNADQYFKDQAAILKNRIIQANANLKTKLNNANANVDDAIKNAEQVLENAKQTKFAITKAKGTTKAQRQEAVRLFEARKKAVNKKIKELKAEKPKLQIKFEEESAKLKQSGDVARKNLANKKINFNSKLENPTDKQLIDLYRQLDDDGIIVTRNSKLDDVLNLMKTESDKFDDFDPAVHELIKYGESVARNNDLMRDELDLNDIDTLLKEIFTGSNRYGAAFFGKKRFDEFEAVFRSRGTKSVEDALKILAKQVEPDAFDQLAKVAKHLLAYSKQIIYTTLIPLRPRFLGMNVATAQAIIFQNLGVLASPGAIKLGTEIAFSSGRQGLVKPPQAIIEGFQTVFSGATKGQSKFYEIAVTDAAGRSYTHGQLYQMVHAAGIRTDVSISRDVTMVRDTLKKLKQPANKFMGLNTKNLLSRGIESFTDLPITSDMAFRVAVAIDAIKSGKSADEAVKMAKVSLFDYNRLLGFEQSLANMTIFYNFTRQNLITTLQALTNPQRFVSLVKFMRANNDLGSLQTVGNDGRMFPYNATMPNYTNVRALISHVKSYSDRDVYLFAPPMPVMEATAMMTQIYSATFGGRGFKSVNDLLIRQLHPLLKKTLLAKYPDTFKQTDRVSPELVTFSRSLSEAQKKILFDNEFAATPLVALIASYSPNVKSTEEWLSYFHGKQVVGEYNPNSMYSVDGYTYKVDKTAKRNAFGTSLMFLLSTIGAETTLKDYHRMFFSAEGTAYEPLDVYEKMAVSLGLLTPIGVRSPEFQDLSVLKNHEALIKQKIQELKKKRTSERENR